MNYSFPRFRGSDNLTLTFTALFDNTRDVRTFTATRLEGSVQVSQKYSKATTFFYRYSYRRVGVSSLNISPLLAPQLAAPVAGGRAFVEHDHGSARRSGGSAQGHLQHDEPRDCGARHRLAEKFPRVSWAAMPPITGSARNWCWRARPPSATCTPFHYNGDPLDAIPLAERFFSGGGTSHRGFPENQAGPRDPSTGFPLGGTALLFNQTELRFPLLGDNIGGVLFHDMGNVYSSIRQISFRLTQHGLNRFRLHGARGWVRYSLSHAGGSGAHRSGLQHQSAAFLWFQGNAAGSVQCGPHAMRPRRPPGGDNAWCRASAIFSTSFPSGRLSDAAARLRIRLRSSRWPAIASPSSSTASSSSVGTQVDHRKRNRSHHPPDGVPESEAARFSVREVRRRRP